MCAQNSNSPVRKGGLLQKVFFRKVPFSRESREFKSRLTSKILEKPQTVETETIQTILEILETSEILEILDLPPVKRPLS